MTEQNYAPLSLVVRLPLASSFHDTSVQLQDCSVAVTLDLAGGPKTAVSEPEPIGTFNGLPVMAQVRFSYDYNRSENELTIHGNDDRTHDQLQITTFLNSNAKQLSGGTQRPEFHTTPNDVGINHPITNIWADHVVKTSPLDHLLQAAARRCNDLLVDTAIEGGVDSVSELGTAPIVTLDNLADYERMYGRPVTTAAAADKVAEIAEMQAIISSTYVGVVTWRARRNFANVIGSTRDPKVGRSSWIRLWKEKCNKGEKPERCTSHNWFSNQRRDCHGSLVGGHVIPGTDALKEPDGARVFIFPICKTHNANDDCYMHAVRNTKGVQLRYGPVPPGAFLAEETPEV